MKKTILVIIFFSFFLSSAAIAFEEEAEIKGTIPFELKEHLIVIKAKINGSQKYYDLVLDTGGLTFIDKEVAKELDLKTRGNMAKMNTLEMGEVSIPNIFAFTTFHTEKFRKHGIIFYGIIGSNLLERFKITIDYRQNKVVLSPDDKQTGENTGGFKCRFTNHRINNAPMIDGTVNGSIPIKAMVDTGQPYSIVFPLEYLDKLEAKNSPSLIKSKGVMIKWPNTSTPDSYLWRIDDFQMGKIHSPNLLCCFAELPRILSVPLLGKDYLSQFLITIDYPHDEILFLPYENAAFVTNKYSFGLSLAKGDNNTVVVEGLWTGGPADEAGIEIGDEVFACNSKPIDGENISELRRLIQNEKIDTIKLTVQNSKGRREVTLRKKTLLKE
ncbi:MAG: aspartyl protease family protein [Candidatus Aminicenantes bacterium]|nr:aspartyl protease family protein [Candidatus Aminicenantes bacterium]